MASQTSSRAAAHLRSPMQAWRPQPRRARQPAWPGFIGESANSAGRSARDLDDLRATCALRRRQAVRPGLQARRSNCRRSMLQRYGMPLQPAPAPHAGDQELAIGPRLKAPRWPTRPVTASPAFIGGLTGQASGDRLNGVAALDGGARPATCSTTRPSATTGRPGPSTPTGDAEGQVMPSISS